MNFLPNLLCLCYKIDELTNAWHTVCHRIYTVIDHLILLRVTLGALPRPRLRWLSNCVELALTCYVLACDVVVATLCLKACSHQSFWSIIFH